MDKILEKAKADTRAAFELGMSDDDVKDLVQAITIDCCRDLALLKDSEDPKALLDAILEIIIF